MKISTCMKQDVVTISDQATIGEAAHLFARRHVGMLPVVNQHNQLVGILNLRDLLELVMPTFAQLIQDIDFVGDFGAVEDRQPSPELIAQPVTAVMEPPISVQTDCGLLRAFTLMNKYRLYDLPVVDPAGQLVGLASRVDVGTALFSLWQEQSP
jgi:CBS-domain-containing membrane protein